MGRVCHGPSLLWTEMSRNHWNMFSLPKKYLGITITDDLDWSQHISEISCKASKTLGFLRRNLALAP